MLPLHTVGLTNCRGVAISSEAADVMMQNISTRDCTRVRDCCLCDEWFEGVCVRERVMGRELLAGLLTVIRCGEYTQECSFDGKCVIGSAPETIEEESLLLFRCTRL